MSLGKVTKALELIQQATSSQYVEVETPISKQKYQIKPITGKDESELKRILSSTKTRSKFTEQLYQVLYNCIANNKNVNDVDNNSDDNSSDILTLDKFLSSNSVFDSYMLFHGLVQATYEYVKDYQFECPNCGAINKIDKLYYSQYQNKSKTWDKDVSFTEYTIKTTIDLNPIKLTFITKIPTILDELVITKKVINKDNTNPEDITSFMMTSSNIDKVTYIIKKLVIEKTLGDNNETETVELDNLHDIRMVLESLPENVLLKVIEDYNNEVNNYVPDFACKVKCKECEHETELTYNPVMELMTRIIFE